MYTIEPLGFSSENDNIVVALFYLYNFDDNKKVFMGTWGYNVLTGETILISPTNPSQEVSANGLVLKQVLD